MVAVGIIQSTSIFVFIILPHWFKSREILDRDKVRKSVLDCRLELEISECVTVVLDTNLDVAVTRGILQSVFQTDPWLLCDTWIEEILYSNLELDLIIRIIRIIEARWVGQCGLDVVSSVIYEVSC